MEEIKTEKNMVVTNGLNCSSKMLVIRAEGIITSMKFIFYWDIIDNSSISWPTKQAYI